MKTWKIKQTTNSKDSKFICYDYPKRHHQILHEMAIRRWQIGMNLENMCQYIFKCYVTYPNLLRHTIKFAHGWQLSKFICVISQSEMSFLFSHVHKLNMFMYSIISMDFYKTAPRSWNILQKFVSKHIQQFSSSWLTYACQLSYSNTQLFSPKRICWQRAFVRTFSTFFCAFHFQPDLSDIFPHVQR